MRKALLIGCILTAGQALAADPVNLIIAGGGTSQAEAERVRASLQRIEKPLQEALTLPQGFPRIIESRTLAGLKPGFWVVALGFCRSVEAPLAAVKAVYPAAYARPLTAQVDEACPKLGKARVNALGPGLKRPGQQVSSFELVTEERDERDHDVGGSTFHFVLVNTGTGEVMSAVELAGASIGRTGDGPAGWEYETCKASVTGGADNLVVRRDCSDERSGCEVKERSIPKEWTETSTVSLRAGALRASPSQKKVTAQEPCGTQDEGD